MGTLMTGLSRGSRTPPAVCACAAALNVPRLHRTRAVPKAAIAILMPRPPCYTQLRRNSDILRRSSSRRCWVYIGHQRRRNRNASFPAAPITRMSGAASGVKATMQLRSCGLRSQHFDFNNLISRAIIVIAGRRHELW